MVKTGFVTFTVTAQRLKCSTRRKSSCSGMRDTLELNFIFCVRAPRVTNKLDKQAQLAASHPPVFVRVGQLTWPGQNVRDLG